MDITKDIDKELVEYFSNLENKIRALAYIGKTDLSLKLEDFMIPIFKIIYSDIFINANRIKRGIEGIDLYSFDKKIGVQITTQKNTEKIKKTIKSAELLNKESDFKIKKLVIFVLANKKYRNNFKSSSFQIDILTIDSIIQLEDEIKAKILKHLKYNVEKYHWNSNYPKYKKLIDEVFVDTLMHEKAKQVLTEENGIIINGNAGVGKTINSYKLLFDLEEKGYTYIYDLDNIPNQNNEKYVVLIEDFITSTNEGIPEFKEVEKALNIFECRNEKFKVILNSRTHIMKSYGNKNSRVNFDRYLKISVDMNKLTKHEKLLILRNHIIKSYDKNSLLTLFKDNLNGSIYEIIEHKKYSPRIIEHLKRDKQESVNDLHFYIINHIEDFDKAYEEEYANLTKAEKDIIFLIYLSNDLVTNEEINDFFKDKYTPSTIKQALDTLNNSFLIQRMFYNDEFKYDFNNPGIKDFIGNKANTIEEKFVVDLFNNTKKDNIIINLMKSDKISLDHKIKKLKGLNEKTKYIISFNYFNKELVNEFKEEIFSEAIDSGRVPYQFIEIYKEDEMNILYSKMNWEKQNLVGSYGITNYFAYLLNSNNKLLLEQDLWEKLENELYDAINVYISEHLEFLLNLRINERKTYEFAFLFDDDDIIENIYSFVSDRILDDSSINNELKDILNPTIVDSFYKEVLTKYNNSYYILNKIRSNIDNFSFSLEDFSEEITANLNYILNDEKDEVLIEIERFKEEIKNM